MNPPDFFSDHSSGVTTNPCLYDVLAPCYGLVVPGQSGPLAMQLGRSIIVTLNIVVLYVAIDNTKTKVDLH